MPDLQPLSLFVLVAGVFALGGFVKGVVGLGLALLLCATPGLLHWRPRVRPAHERWLAPIVGLATGLVTAATGVFVIPAVPYLHALGMEKETLVRALGISFLVSTIALGIALGQGRRRALPAHRIAAHSGAFNCRF